MSGSGVTGSETLPFAGRFCVVTGATQGLGEAVAVHLADHGAAGLVLVGRDRQRGEAVASGIESRGCAARLVCGDLADLTTVDEIIATTESAFGTVHGLANVAALTARGDIWSTTAEEWDRMMAVNLRAPFFLLQGIADLMERTGVEGSIVTIGSVAGNGGAPRLLPYSVSKGALQTLTKNAAFSLARHRIRVNLLQIGWMNSPAEHAIQTTVEGQPEDWLSEAAAAQPFGRLLEPAEVARAVGFLLSAESGMMTGAVVDFDQSVLGGGDQSVPGPEVVRPSSRPGWAIAPHPA